MFSYIKETSNKTTHIEILDIIDELRAEPKTNNKKKILEEHRDNEHWLAVLKYAYEPEINYGVISLDEECFQNHHKHNAEPFGLEYMYALLQKLANREITGNKAKDEIRDFCRNCYDGLQDLLQLILWRDLDIGASIKTFNKIYSKEEPFIYVFETMSARGKTIKYPCIGNTKLNGQRLVIEKENGEIKFISRNGKEYTPHYLIKQAEFLLAEKDNIVLDCEIDGIPSEYGETSLYNSDAVRLKVNGHINQFIRGTAPMGLDMKFRVNVFDVLSLDEFKGKKKSKIIQERMEDLVALFDGVELHNFRYEEPVIINNADEAQEFYYHIVSNKGEGAIFKLLDKPYQLGDSQYWVKAKQEVDVDLEIVGFYRGAKGGKREHTVGGVHLKSSDDLLYVDCGSGLKDSDIEFILDNQDWLIGKVVQVRFNTISKDKKTKINSLFLPRFVGGNKNIGNFEASLRLDKDIANTFEEIKLEELNAQRFLFKKEN